MIGPTPMGSSAKIIFYSFLVSYTNQPCFSIIYQGENPSISRMYLLHHGIINFPLKFIKFFGIVSLKYSFHFINCNFPQIFPYLIYYLTTIQVRIIVVLLTLLGLRIAVISVLNFIHFLYVNSLSMVNSSKVYFCCPMSIL